MTELKTLKDMAFLMDFMQEPTKLVREDRLRQEAIKWVKKLGCRIDKGYFQRFFNITEEDLKKEVQE